MTLLLRVWMTKYLFSNVICHCWSCWWGWNVLMSQLKVQSCFPRCSSAVLWYLTNCPCNPIDWIKLTLHQPGLSWCNYCKTSNISRTLVGNNIVDNSHVVDNYIFILNLTPGFNVLSEDNCNRIQETFKLWDLVRLILEVLRWAQAYWCLKNKAAYYRQHFQEIVSIHVYSKRYRYLEKQISPGLGYGLVLKGRQQATSWLSGDENKPFKYVFVLYTEPELGHHCACRCPCT